MNVLRVYIYYKAADKDSSFFSLFLLCLLSKIWHKGRIKMKPLPEFYQFHLRLASLIMGSGDTFYTVVVSFRFWEMVALTASVSPAIISGKEVALIAPSFLRLLLRFDRESVLDLHFCSPFAQSTLDLNILVDFLDWS